MGDIYVQFIYFLHHVCLIQVTIALRFHLFPFRTEKLSSVTPMVLRNSGRVGSRRFFREAPVSEDAGAFLFWGYFVCLALYLPCFACFSFLFFSFLCFACFLGVSRFLVGIILYLWSIFLSLLLGYYIISYHIIPISHHISGKHLLLCLSVLMSEKKLCLLCGEEFYLCLFKQVLKFPFPFPYRMSIP